MPATILYDAPSARAKPLFVLGRDTPLEVIVPVEGWTEGPRRRRHDRLGREAQPLASAGRSSSARPSPRFARIPMKPRRSRSAPSTACLLELAEPATGATTTAMPGWVKVEHRDGQSGLRPDHAGVRPLSALRRGVDRDSRSTHSHDRDRSRSSAPARGDRAGRAPRAPRDLAVTLWARDPGQARAIAGGASTRRYLPDVALPDALSVTADSTLRRRGAADRRDADRRASGCRRRARARRGARRSSGCRKGSSRCAAGAAHPAGVALAHQVIAPMWPAPVGIVSGPSFAEEVARGLADGGRRRGDRRCARGAGRLAAARRHVARLRERRHRRRRGRRRGEERAGDRRRRERRSGFGNNARAALITRGLAETGRLSAALGGRRDTLMGLAGLGDLVLTCTGDLSRNRRVGLALAQGKSLVGSPGRAGPRRRGRGVRARCASCRAITASKCRSATPCTRCLYEGLSSQASAVERLARRASRGPERH